MSEDNNQVRSVVEYYREHVGETVVITQKLPIPTPQGVAFASTEGTLTEVFEEGLLIRAAGQQSNDQLQIWRWGEILYVGFPSRLATGRSGLLQTGAR